MNWALPLATLLIAGASLVVSTILASRSMSRSASTEYVDQLEKRINECDKDRSRLHAEVGTLRKQLNALRDREFELMARLLKLENGDH